MHPLTLISYFIAQVVLALDVPTKHLGHFMKLSIGGAEEGHHGLGLQSHHLGFCDIFKLFKVVRPFDRIVSSCRASMICCPCSF